MIRAGASLTQKSLLSKNRRNHFLRIKYGNMSAARVASRRESWERAAMQWRCLTEIFSLAWAVQILRLKSRVKKTLSGKAFLRNTIQPTINGLTSLITGRYRPARYTLIILRCNMERETGLQFNSN